MPFETRKIKFTVFSLNHELYSSIESAFNMKFKPKIDKRTHMKTATDSSCIALCELHHSRDKIAIG